MTRFRRTKYVFAYFEDREFLDIGRLLHGEAVVAPLRQILAISVLTGKEHVVSRAELDLLASVPSDQWTERDGEDAEALAELARKGLVLSDAHDDSLRELRRRDESLASSQWNIYAALFHFLTKSEDVVLLRKTSPSGGALHPTEVYPLIRNVENVEPGLYHYNVERHELELLSALTPDEGAGVAFELASGQPFVRDAPAIFLLTTRFYRNFWKYRRHRRAYAVLLMDAAHLTQSFYLVCTELGLGAFVTAAVNGANIEERLGLDPFAEGALAMCGCGRPAARQELDVPFLPYVPRETVI